MPAVLHVAGRNATSIGASATQFWPVGMVDAGGSNTVGAAQRTARTPGTMSQLAIQVTSNDRGASSLTFRVGGSNTALTVPITASTTGRFVDLTHTAAVAAADLIDSVLVTGAGGASFVARLASVLFTATSGAAVSLWCAAAGNTLSTDSTTFFTPISGAATEAAEALVQVKAQMVGTWRNMSVNMRTNTRGTTTNVKSRINGADGAQVVPVTAGGTGQFEDLTHSDTTAVNDLLAIAYTLSTGGGNFRVWLVASEFSTASTATCVAALGNPVTLVASATRYHQIGGSPSTGSATESDIVATAGANFTISCAAVNVATNTVVGDSSLQVRKNAATNLNSVVPITGLTTGQFADLTHTDDIVAADTLSYLLTAGAAGTSLSVGCYSMLWTYTGFAHLLSNTRSRFVQVAA